MSGSSSSQNQASSEVTLASLSQQLSAQSQQLNHLTELLNQLCTKKASASKKGGAPATNVNGAVSPLQASGAVTDGAVVGVGSDAKKDKTKSFPNVNIFFRKSDNAETRLSETDFVALVPESVRTAARVTAEAKAGWVKADAATQENKVRNEYWGAISAIMKSEAHPNKAEVAAFHASVVVAHKAAKPAAVATPAGSPTSESASQHIGASVNEDDGNE